MKHALFFAVLLVLLVASVFGSVLVGRYPLDAADVCRFVLHPLFGPRGLDPQQLQTVENLLWDIRAPRIFSALLTGAALSVSGATFQSMFINPLVSPGVLGVLAGASFGAALGMVASVSWGSVQLLSFLFGLAAVVIAVGVARLYRDGGLLMLILGGIISGSLFTSLFTMVKYLADPYNELPALIYWLMGGFSLADAKTLRLLAGPVLAGIVGLVLLAGKLNVLTMGDEEARSLGLSVGATRLLLILLATLVSSATVVLGGVIGWVGLIIPHVGRMLVGPDNRILLPASALIGGIYLLLVDDLARLIFQVEIPIGIITSLLGIPFFAAALKYAGRGWK